MSIPESLLNDFRRVPRDRPVALLMRHSVRFPITDPERGFEVPLTEEGVRLAEELGALFGKEFPGGRLLAAPVGRCLATADAIARGAGWARQALAEHRISHPVIEPAWDLLNAGKVNGSLPAPILNALELLLSQEGEGPLLDVLVTHDTVLGAVAGCLLKGPVLGEAWPVFLEGMFFWRSDDRIYVLWRGKIQAFTQDGFQQCELS